MADEDKQVIEAFVCGAPKVMGREYDGIHRMTFLIDENGVVERVIEKVKDQGTRSADFGIIIPLHSSKRLPHQIAV